MSEHDEIYQCLGELWKAAQRMMKQIAELEQRIARLEGQPAEAKPKRPQLRLMREAEEATKHPPSPKGTKVDGFSI